MRRDARAATWVSRSGTGLPSRGTHDSSSSAVALHIASMRSFSCCSRLGPRVPRRLGGFSLPAPSSGADVRRYRFFFVPSGLSSSGGYSSSSSSSSSTNFSAGPFRPPAVWIPIRPLAVEICFFVSSAIERASSCGCTPISVSRRIFSSPSSSIRAPSSTVDERSPETPVLRVAREAARKAAAASATVVAAAGAPPAAAAAAAHFF